MKETEEKQALAWSIEHEGVLLRHEGKPYRSELMFKAASEIRHKIITDEITVLFARSDAQNQLLDGIDLAKGHKRPIPIFTAGVDYTLMQQ